MDRDIRAVDSFINDFKSKHPAQSAPKLRATDIALPNGTIVTVMEGDLTKMRCDAIASSSGPDLTHTSGVSRAIAQACGQRFIAKGRQFIDTAGVLHEGETFVQPADGSLAMNGVKHVIHAIAPIPQRGREPIALLVKTVRSAVAQAEILKCKTVALPAICAGNIGVPIETCAECYWSALDVFSSQSPHPCLKQIFFVIDDPICVSQIHQSMSILAVQSNTSDRHHAHGSQPTPHGRQHLRPEQVMNTAHKSLTKESTNTTYAARYEGRISGVVPSSIQTSSRLNPARHYGGAGPDHSHAGASHAQRGGASGSSASGYHNSSEHYGNGSFDLTGMQRGGASGSVGHNRSGVRQAAGVHGSGPSSKHLRTAVRYEDRISGATAATHQTSSHLDPVGHHRGGSYAAGANATPAATGASQPNDNECSICMDDLKNPIALVCSHKFCKDCIDLMVKTSKSNLCPTCRTPFRNADGQQPKGGGMITTHSDQPRLPGYERYGTITITYSLPSGIQGPEHPNPGQPYHCTSRTAYLPDNPQGRKVEKLLRKAFNQRLTFTIGQSVTTGQDNCIVWNDIHHKTNVHGGSSNYGYPDPQYMDRLIEDLRAKGITE